MGLGEAQPVGGEAGADQLGDHPLRVHLVEPLVDPGQLGLLRRGHPVRGVGRYAVRVLVDEVVAVRLGRARRGIEVDGRPGAPGSDARLRQRGGADGRRGPVPADLVPPGQTVRRGLEVGEVDPGGLGGDSVDRRRHRLGSRRVERHAPVAGDVQVGLTGERRLQHVAVDVVGDGGSEDRVPAGRHPRGEGVSGRTAEPAVVDHRVGEVGDQDVDPALRTFLEAGQRLRVDRQVIAGLLDVEAHRGGRDQLAAGGAGGDGGQVEARPGRQRRAVDPEGRSGGDATLERHPARRQRRSAARHRLSVVVDHRHVEVEGGRRRGRRTGPAQLRLAGPGLRVCERAEVDHRLVAGRAAKGPGRVEPAGPDGVRVDAGQRVGGTDECGLELLAGPVGVPLGEQRGGARHVRAGHRGAADALVVRVDRVLQVGAGGPGGHDVDTGCDQLRLGHVAGDQRSTAGKVGELVIAVDGADGQRAGGRARARRWRRRCCRQR